MAKKLFVGNLAFGVKDDELRELFTNAGFSSVTSATVITDKFSGKSRGFGFVELENDEEAQNAIQNLNGQDMGGRNITVNEARPTEPRRPGGGGGFRRPGGGGGRGGYGGGRGGYGSDNG
ncbi:MAG: RNA-binding protein [Candidatus Doudnabacteria bacterium]|nr:RNA-binding protein [Candidatus Doudnabacteria bacterium]